MHPALIAFIVIAGVAIIYLAAAIKIVKHAHAYTLERLGKYHRTLESGIHIIIPIVDRISNKISLKEQANNKERCDFLCEVTPFLPRSHTFYQF